MQGRAVVVLGALVCFAVAGLGPARAAAAEKAKATAPAPDLSGTWRLDKQLSDDAREKMREQMERRGGGPGPGMSGPGMGGPGMGGGGRLAPPPGMGGGADPSEAMKPIFDPAEELTIFQGQPDIVIDEKYSRRRTLHADGRKYKTENGTAEVKTEWKDASLVIETRGFRGQKTTETWELSATGKRLTSSIKVENGLGGKATIKRVYDRSGDAPPQAAPDAAPPQD